MTIHSMYRKTMTTNQPQLKDSAVSNPLPDTDQRHRIEYTAVAASLGWSGWGSPVGLGILLISTGFFLLCLHWAGVVH